MASPDNKILFTETVLPQPEKPSEELKSAVGSLAEKRQIQKNLHADLVGVLNQDRLDALKQAQDVIDQEIAQALKNKVSALPTEALKVLPSQQKQELKIDRIESTNLASELPIVPEQAPPTESAPTVVAPETSGQAKVQGAQELSSNPEAPLRSKFYSFNEQTLIIDGGGSEEATIDFHDEESIYICFRDKIRKGIKFSKLVSKNDIPLNGLKYNFDKLDPNTVSFRVNASGTLELIDPTGKGEVLTLPKDEDDAEEDEYDEIAKNRLDFPKVIETKLGKVGYGTDEGYGYKDENGSQAENEDAVVFYTKGDFVGLSCIDGMGGHANGRRAAEILANLTKDGFKNKRSFKAIHQSAYMEMRDSGLIEGGACYLSAKVENNVLKIAHAGDVKLIVISSNGEVTFQTRDHLGTKPGQVINGVTANYEGYADEYGDQPLRDGDRVIIASDGLWDNISPEDLSEIVQGCTIEEAMRKIAQVTKERMLSNQTGTKPDNRSLIIYDHVYQPPKPEKIPQKASPLPPVKWRR